MNFEKPKELRQGDESTHSRKEPHFISSRLLKALGGIKEETAVGELVDQGAYLWGVKKGKDEEKDEDNTKKGSGIFKHILLTSRTAYALAKELKEKGAEEYKDIDLKKVVEAAILHDITKLYGEDREKLPPELKKTLGLPLGFREISQEVDETGISWLLELGFSDEVSEAIRSHDFPEKVVDNSYWKIILLADYMSTSQKIIPVEERLQDVKTRWIDQPLDQGREPRIEPERFQKAQANIEQVAQEIFQLLGLEDKIFIEERQLNSDKSMNRWEKFLIKTRDEKTEERAKRHVKGLIKE